jgi:hypothetical protein
MKDVGLLGKFGKKGEKFGNRFQSWEADVISGKATTMDNHGES